MARLKSVAWIFPCLVALWAYWPAFGFGLVWDDFEILNDLLPIFEKFGDAFTQKGLYGLPMHYYRPWVLLSLMFNRWVFDGVNPTSLHATMIFTHLLATLFCYGICTLLFKDHPNGRLAAVIASLVFAVHPIHTEVVGWISGHPDAWMTSFFLGSFFFFLRWREREKTRWLGLSLAFFLLALFSKETAVILLFLIFLYDFFVGRTLFRKDQLMYLFVFIVYFIVRSQFVTEGSIPNPKEASLLFFLKKIVLAYGFYIEKTIYPFELNAFIKEIPSHSLTIALGILFIVTAVVFGVSRLRKKYPLIAFHLIFFLATAAPAVLLAVSPIARTEGAERYLYLPSYALSFFAGLFILQKHRASKISAGILLAALLASYAFKTYARLPAWRDELAFWQETSRQNPDQGLPYFNLGLAYKRKPDPEKALEYYKKALEAKYDRQGRAIVYNSMGILHLERREYDLAESFYQKAIAEVPYAYPFCNLGVLYHIRADESPSDQRKGWLKKSVEFLQRCVEKTPRNKKWENLFEKAKADLEQAP